MTVVKVVVCPCAFAALVIGRLIFLSVFYFVRTSVSFNMASIKTPPPNFWNQISFCFVTLVKVVMSLCM